MKRFLWVLAAGGILLVVIEPGLIPLAVILQLTTGWFLFLTHVIPQMQIDWSGLLSGVICIFLLAFGIYQVGGWFAQTWRWRWTLSILAVVVLMFVSGISAVGMIHQMVWLAQSKEPFFLKDYGMGRLSRWNLGQIGVAVHGHFDLNKELPPGVTFDRFGKPLHGWQIFLLPFIEQENFYKLLDLNQPWNDPRNDVVAKEFIPIYSFGNPDEQGYYPMTYAANVHLFMGEKRYGLIDMPDGTSNTIMAGEIGTNLKPWMYPLNWRDPVKGINKHPDGFGSATNSPVGANILMADGGVFFKSEKISAATLKAVSTPAGGEPIPPDWLE